MTLPETYTILNYMSLSLQKESFLNSNQCFKFKGNQHTSLSIETYDNNTLKPEWYKMNI